jgi:DNA-binding beta-propeller fold protein YncE
VGTDENGNVYVADYAGNKVAVYTPDNKLLKEWEVPLPLDVAVTKDRIYVSTLAGVAAFERDYSFVGLWGRRGGGPEEFDTPRGIVAGPDGTVYVSDTNNARVKAYSKDGVLKWIWPADRREAKRPGAGNEIKTQLQLPSAMSMDGKGRLVLTDPFRFQLVVIDPDQPEKAKLVDAYGDQGSTDGLFAYPTGIAYDPARDWFAVADTSNDRVQLIRIPGTAANPVGPALARAFAGPWWLCAIPLALLLVAAVLVYLRVRAARADRIAEAEAVGADTESLLATDEDAEDSEDDDLGDVVAELDG